MSLSTGTSLGSFEISGLLGVGGMGEVYRARDTKLGREVAIKVLPELFAKDKDRLARFEREAKLLAALNHPNIAGIHDLCEENGTHFLVMELVEGQALNEKLKLGAMSVEEALPLFAQIAEALENAHEQGIVHRDLKPANIKVTAAGKIKVLDFGLAKAFQEQAPSQSSPGGTIALDSDSAGITGEGKVLGTPAYMSPEQASGKPVDKRADIWAFGCCLYEALTGKRPFQGDSTTQLLARILEREPDWDALPKEIPARVRILLWRCLQKNPQRRLRDIGEARFEIGETSSDPSGVVPVLGTTAAPAPASRGGVIAGALVGLVLGAAIAAGVFLKSESAPELPLRKLQIPLYDFKPGDEVGTPVISPDGSMLAFNQGGGLWVRNLDRLDARQLPGTEGAVQAFWSPDSEWVGFGANFKLWKVRVSGGQPIPLTELRTEGLESAAGAAWTEEGQIIFTDGVSPLLEVSARGGNAKTALEPREDEADFHEASPLPDGKGVLSVAHAERRGWPIIVLNEEGRKDVHVVEDQFPHDPVYSPTGHILYQIMFEGRVPFGIWAVPFSLDKLETTGEPFLVAPGGTNPSVSSDGTLTYVTDVNRGEGQFVWVDREGNRIEAVGDPHATMRSPSFSSNGRRVAVSVGWGDDSNIWIIDLESGDKQRLTWSPDPESEPAWAPEADLLAYTRVVSDEPAIYVQPTDGSAEARRIVQGSGADFSADGEHLVFTRLDEETGRDLWIVNLEGEAEPKPLLQTPADESGAKVSLDGRYLAYFSDESGEREVWIMPYGGGEGRRQVSVDGSTRFIHWGPSGEKLYYSSFTSGIMEVDVTTTPSLTIGMPRSFFTVARMGRPAMFGFAIGADSERLLMISPVGRVEDRPSIVVVQNWFKEFEGAE